MEKLSGGVNMPKRARELAALAVSRLKTPGMNAVGSPAGLYLQISPRGSRSWVLRTMIGGRRRDMGLGGYPDVPLAEAREKARRYRAMIEEGIDPIAERRAAKARLMAESAKSITFDECARRVIAIKQVEFKSTKHAAQWPATLATYASPVIGKLPVDAIELGHVTEILSPIWQTKTETATRLRGRIEAVLDYATVHGLRSGPNPARWRGNLDAVLPKPGKIKRVQHFRALPIDEVPAFITDLRRRDGMGARSLEFAIFTAARSGEIRGATWDEIDIENNVWKIPASRMKAGKEHRVPLSVAAVELLNKLPRIAGVDLVFPATRGGMMSDMTLTNVMRRMGVEAVPHGFRSTFRDWCAERTAYPQHVVEMALAHAIGDKVEAAYRRGDLFAKRVRLMDDWASFCLSPQHVGDVVPIRAEARG